MQYQHISLCIKGFYKMAFLSNKWEAIVGTNAQQKLGALEFRHKHGFNAASDALKVSPALDLVPPPGARQTGKLV